MILGKLSKIQASNLRLMIIFFSITANTFIITSSTRTPMDGSPGPIGDATYKYISSFMNHESNDITKFIKTSSGKFSYQENQIEIDYNGLMSRTSYTSTNTPKTATQINISLHISSPWDSIYLGGCTFAVYTPGATQTIC